MKKTLGLRKLTRHLLASTCLTVAAGTASAGTISEPPDFGNTFSAVTPLLVGTTGISGSLTAVSDANDWVEFFGLQPGGAFSFTGSVGANFFPQVSVWNSADTINLVTFSLPGSGGGGTIPSDGILVVDLNNSEGSGSYTLNLAAPLASAPEPATVATVGLALAGAFALRRKRT